MLFIPPPDFEWNMYYSLLQVSMFVCVCVAPAPPYVSTNGTSATSISIQWRTVDIDVVLGFILTYSPVNGSCKGVEGGTAIVIGNQTHRHILERLEESTSYMIFVQTKGDHGYGIPSSPALIVKTLSAGM